MDGPPASGAGIGILRPLRHRDFRLLWLGQTISLIGDGIYIFAMAWFVYQDLDATPSTFAYVGAAWALPQVVLLLATGALSDRMDRRHLMIAGDLLRMGAITAIGLLIIVDAMTVPLLVVLVVPYGAGQAIFEPAFSAIIPMIVPEEQLVEANSLGHTVRPLCMIVIGPLVAAMVVYTAGTGYAFLVDALTFAVSAGCIAMMAVRNTKGTDASTTFLADVREGFAYVRSTRWILMGLLGGSVSIFAVWAPWEALVPFVVTDQMDGNELQLALVYGAGGVGSIVAALYMAQRGLPRRPLTVMYVAWAVGMGATAGFGLVSTIWQAMVIAAVTEAGITVLVVIWFTALQRLVPNELLGRVSSIDWMITILGLPAAFLIVGPLADVFGADAVLIAAGILGAGATLFFMTRRGARDPDRDGSLEVAEPSPAAP